MSEAWTIARVVRWASDDFRSRAIESPRLEAELLLAYALGIDRLRIFVESERELEAGELARFREIVRRRRTREPVAYIRGEREFYGRAFRVDRRVLVPRPDTETLVEVALSRTARVSLCARVLDLCTGSGCVAITLARERPTTRVDAVDLSTDALAVARDNAARLGAHLVRFVAGDLFAPLDPARDRYDLITANAPYIADGAMAELPPDVRDHEPHLALAGGDDGLALVRRIVAGATRFLLPGGVLALEVGAGQAPAVAQLVREAGFTGVAVARDYGGIERVVSGVRSGDEEPR